MRGCILAAGLLALVALPAVPQEVPQPDFSQIRPLEDNYLLDPHELSLKVRSGRAPAARVSARVGASVSGTTASSGRLLLHWALCPVFGPGVM